MIERTDTEAITGPVKLHVKLIERFMRVLGPVSSIFDFITFYAKLHLFVAGAALFQTGWFIESMTRQSLVVFCIRIHRVAWCSRPERFLIATTLGAVIVALLLPVLPIAH